MILKVEVFTSTCAKCKMLDVVVRTAVQEMEIEADIKNIHDAIYTKERGVSRVPALFINNKLILEGQSADRDRNEGHHKGRDAGLDIRLICLFGNWSGILSCSIPTFSYLIRQPYCRISVWHSRIGIVCRPPSPMYLRAEGRNDQKSLESLSAGIWTVSYPRSVSIASSRTGCLRHRPRKIS